VKQTNPACVDSARLGGILLSEATAVFSHCKNSRLELLPKVQSHSVHHRNSLVVKRLPIFNRVLLAADLNILTIGSDWPDQTVDYNQLFSFRAFPVVAAGAAGAAGAVGAVVAAGAVGAVVAAGAAGAAGAVGAVVAAGAAVAAGAVVAGGAVVAVVRFHFSGLRVS